MLFKNNPGLSQALLGLAVLLVGAPSALAEDAWVRPGQEGLDGAQLEAFEARYEVTLMGELLGQRRMHLQEAEVSGEAGLQLRKTLQAGDTMVEEIQFLRGSLRPVAQSTVSMQQAHRIEVWTGEAVRGFRIEADGSAAERVEIALDGARFAGLQFPLMLASMPLSKGLEMKIPLIVSQLGPARAHVTATVRVKAREDIEAMTGEKYSAWVIECDLLDAEGNPVRPPTTFWLADEAPYVIRSDTGGRMLVELVEVL